jgi:hypothetical protein
MMLCIDLLGGGLLWSVTYNGELGCRGPSRILHAAIGVTVAHSTIEQGIAGSCTHHHNKNQLNQKHGHGYECGKARLESAYDLNHVHGDSAICARCETVDMKAADSHRFVVLSLSFPVLLSRCAWSTEI